MRIQHPEESWDDLLSKCSCRHCSVHHDRCSCENAMWSMALNLNLSFHRSGLASNLLIKSVEAALLISVNDFRKSTPADKAASRAPLSHPTRTLPCPGSLPPAGTTDWGLLQPQKGPQSVSLSLRRTGVPSCSPGHGGLGWSKQGADDFGVYAQDPRHVAAAVPWYLLVPTVTVRLEWRIRRTVQGADRYRNLTVSA
jgi:hypothetical protein